MATTLYEQLEKRILLLDGGFGTMVQGYGLQEEDYRGARFGDGGLIPGNHFWWQGKFYSRTGRTPDLPLFVESTGYGTGECLCGWNCRHSFGPGCACGSGSRSRSVWNHPLSRALFPKFNQ